MLHEEITGTIIGCAYEVYNVMGHGYLESVYEQCILHELQHCGLVVASQHPIKVYYRGVEVGTFVADLLVEEVVIVELKAVRTILMAHEVQLVNYLKATGIDLGLLINFGEDKCEIKRKVRVLPKAVVEE